jgi:HK97 family phage prohead protease
VIIMAVALDKMFTQAAVEKGTFDDDERSFVAWASRPVVDRDHEIIAHNAWDLENYEKNSVLLWAHDYTKPPIGKVMWIKQQKNGLKFKPQFASTEMGREIYELYKDGFMNTFSVGFIPNEWEDDEDKAKEGEFFNKPLRTYTDVELLEISCVPVPACPDALVDRYKKGMIKTKGLRDAIEHVIPKEAPDAATEMETVNTSAGEVSGGWEPVEVEERDPIERMRIEGLEKAEGGIVPVTTELWNAIMDDYKAMLEKVASSESEEEAEEVIVTEPEVEYTEEEFDLMVKQGLENRQQTEKIKEQNELIVKLLHDLAEVGAKLNVLQGGVG